MQVIHEDIDYGLGIKTKVHSDGNKVVFEKQYDAQPFVDAATEIRNHTSGEKWGEMRHVGFIPMAELGKMMRQDGTVDKKRMIAFLKANPKLATFDKVLK